MRFFYLIGLRYANAVPNVFFFFLQDSFNYELLICVFTILVYIFFFFACILVYLLPSRFFVIFQDVKKIAYLIHTNAPQLEIEKAVVNGVNRRFYDKDVPEDVVEVLCTVVSPYIYIYIYYPRKSKNMGYLF